MDFKKSNKLYYISIFAVFLLGGILHALLFGVDFASCFAQLFYGPAVILWGLTMNRRITDRRVRNILWGIVLFLVMYFLLQICKYQLFCDDETARRYLWLAYYIPMTMVPLLLFYLALYMNLQPDESPSRKFALLSIPAFALIILIMTNDLHHLFCRYAGADTSVTLQNAGIVFYLFWAYALLLLIMASVIMLRKCQISALQKNIWIPLLPVAVSAILYALDILGLEPQIMGAEIWETGEIFAFGTIGFLEGCILAGLIPANTSYEWFFEKTDIPAVIEDTEGSPIYASAGAKELTCWKEGTAGLAGNGHVTGPAGASGPAAAATANTPAAAAANSAAATTNTPAATATSELAAGGEDVHIQTAAISGGSVSWMVDMSAMHALNRQIEDATERIKARNNYLKTQIDLEEERSAVDARNRVYDRIAGIVESQLAKIDELLSVGTEDDFPDRLKKITVYNAYIKRRGNLELLRENCESLSAAEVSTAIAESVEYLKLNSIEVALSSLAEGRLPADVAILAYEFFEAAAEAVMEEASMLSVVLSRRENTFSLRMIADSTALPLRADWGQNTLATCGGALRITQNDADTVLALSFELGGEHA